MEDSRFVSFIIKKTVGHVDFDPETGFRVQTVYMTDDILREIQAEGRRYGYTDQQISEIVNVTTHSINTNPSITTHYNNLDISRLEAGTHIELNFRSDKFGGTRLGLVAAGRLKFIVVESTVTGLQVNDVVKSFNTQWNIHYSIEFLIYRNGNRYPDDSHSLIIENFEYYRLYAPSFIYQILDSQDDFELEQTDIATIEDNPENETAGDQSYPIMRYAWQPSTANPVTFTTEDLDTNNSSLFRIEQVDKNNALLTINNINPPEWHWMTSIVRRYCDCKTKEADSIGFVNIEQGTLKRVVTGSGKESWLVVKKPKVKILEKKKEQDSSTRQNFTSLQRQKHDIDNDSSGKNEKHAESTFDKKEDKHQRIPRKIFVLLAIAAAILLLSYAFYTSYNRNEDRPIIQSVGTTLADTLITTEAIPKTATTAIKMAKPVPVIPADFVLVPAGRLKAVEYKTDGAVLDSFYICRHELTQGEYKQHMKKLKEHNYSYSYYYEYYNNGYHFKKGTTKIQDDSIPVIATYNELAEYCNIRSKEDGYDGFYIISENGITLNKNGNGYRLPTEYEWSFAAVGGAKNKRYNYVGSNKIKEVAWYGGNSGYRPHKIEQKKPNNLGIYDMSGNVSEMLEEYYPAYKAHYHAIGNFYLYSCLGPYDIGFSDLSSSTNPEIDDRNGARLVLVPKEMKNNNLNEL